MIDNFRKLNKQQLKTVIGMIDYCLRNGIALGMDEGYRLSDSKPTAERLALENLVKTSQQ